MKTNITIVIGVLLAGLLLNLLYHSGYYDSSKTAVVALKDLPKGTQLSASMLRTEPPQPDCLFVQNPALEPYLGKTINFRVYRGQKLAIYDIGAPYDPRHFARCMVSSQNISQGQRISRRNTTMAWRELRGNPVPLPNLAEGIGKEVRQDIAEGDVISELSLKPYFDESRGQYRGFGYVPREVSWNQ
jgi:flagella basal body P-ring formation protein FlgA